MQLCNLHLVVCVITAHPLACQIVGNIPFSMPTLGGRSFKYRELEAKLGGGQTFVGGPSLARLWYIHM